MTPRSAIMASSTAAIFLLASMGLATTPGSWPQVSVDCANIPTSVGRVPAELVDACWAGPSTGDSETLIPSDLAIGPDMVNGNLVDFALDLPEEFNPIGTVATSPFVGGCEFAGNDFSQQYCADGGNVFFTYDTATASRANIATLNPIPPAGETVTGFAWDSSTSTMYMCTTNVGTSSLMTVNLATGATTYVGQISGAGCTIACAIDTAGDMWGYDICTDDFWSIDKATGAGTQIGPIGFNANFGQGMDFDDSDGTCYIFAFNNTTFQAELRTCDTSTGATTFLGALGATIPGGLTQISGAGILATGEVPTMFATDDLTDSLYGVNPATGAATLVGPCGEDLSLSGLAWDSWHNIMYVSDVTNPGGDWALGTVDLATGAVTIIGDHVNSFNIHGLAFDSTNNVLYGADIDCPGLATVNRLTGESTCIGPWTTATDIRGLGYNNDTDTLFGADPTDLYTIDRATGAETVVGAHGINIGFLIGLEYDAASGTLYAGGDGDPNLYSLDMGTGAATLIGPTGLSGLSGLAATTAPPIFADGFESGDTSFWSGTVP